MLFPNMVLKQLAIVDDAFSLVGHITAVYAQASYDLIMNEVRVHAEVQPVGALWAFMEVEPAVSPLVAAAHAEVQDVFA